MLVWVRKSSTWISGFKYNSRWYPFVYLGGERRCESKVPCPRTQHNVPDRDQTRPAWSGVEHTNHEATMPVAFGNFFLVIFDTWFDWVSHIESFDIKISDYVIVQTLYTAVKCAFCLFDFIYKLFPNRS